MPKTPKRGDRVKIKGKGTGSVERSKDGKTSVRLDRTGQLTHEQTSNVEPESPGGRK